MMQIIRIPIEDKHKRLDDLATQLRAHRGNLSKAEQIGFDRACSALNTWIQRQERLLGENCHAVADELADPHLWG